jgi:aldehyde dehydrogenase (NAD+)
MKEACMKDMGRGHFFTELGEIGGVQEYCHHFIDNLERYMEDVHFDPPIIFAPMTSKIRYEPLGVALIFGSWNYPYYVTLKPLVQAIASGNSACIKPSELSPCTSAVI